MSYAMIDLYCHSYDRPPQGNRVKEYVTNG
jgi:hypothetical protein